MILIRKASPRVPSGEPMNSLERLLVCLFLSSVASLAQGQLSPLPSVALGQPAEVPAGDPKTNTPNLVEGREFNQPQSVAVDPVSGAVYVSDTANNRVLGWTSSASADRNARADVVIGQKDFFTTGAGMPATLQSGLNQPTGLAVNANGDLFVVDAGNNRILRYPRPFDQPEVLKLADLVIGQPNLSSRAPNAGGLSASSIVASTSQGAAYRTGLEFDADGNLWFTDAGNHRVLRYPASSLGAGAGNGPAATVVLGQPGMTTKAPLGLKFEERPKLNGHRFPSDVAVDSQGRVFVVDQLLRALVYLPPFDGAKLASRVMGLVAVEQGQPVPPPINARTMGVVLQGNNWLPPEGVFTIGNVPFIVDTPASRILRFAPFDQWEVATDIAPSPAAVAVIGQDSMNSNAPMANRGGSEPRADTLFEPVGAAVGPGNQVWVADSLNNRALGFPDLSNGSGPVTQATGVLGQPGFPNRAINRIEGREFYFRSQLVSAADVVIDWNARPPHMYVADPNNHRVLGFRDARRIRNGSSADVVIGQPGMFRSIVNYPSNDPGRPNQNGLFFPLGLEVDGKGNLYVADWGNSRVLRFPPPFDQPPGLQTADLVLGQFSFTSKITDATASTMAAPYGLTLTHDGRGLLVSDTGHNRVLMFTGQFTNGMAASRVFGQPDTTSTGAGAADDPSRMNSPRGISTDGSDRLYVADANNNRILAFQQVWGVSSDGPPAVNTLTGLKAPLDVDVSAATGKVWVADTNNNRVLRYPNFDQWQFGKDLEFKFGAATPLAVSEDWYGNLYVADGLNRVVGHFQALTATNAAHGLQRLAPGLIATAWFPPDPLIATGHAAAVPLPTEINDISVLVNGKPAPLWFVSSGQINFLLSNDLPSSGNVELAVIRPSTLQIIASNVAPLDVASPGFFTWNQQGTGPAAISNFNEQTQAYSNNSASNPVEAGKVAVIWATGAGHIPGAPPDGEVATAAIPTPAKPVVWVGSRTAEVLYSGVAPGLVGVWQITIRIPADTPAGEQLTAAMIYDRTSGDPSRPGSIVTTIFVK